MDGNGPTMDGPPRRDNRDYNPLAPNSGDAPFRDYPQREATSWRDRNAEMQQRKALRGVDRVLRPGRHSSVVPPAACAARVWC